MASEQMDLKLLGRRRLEIPPIPWLPTPPPFQSPNPQNIYLQT